MYCRFAIHWLQMWKVLVVELLRGHGCLVFRFCEREAPHENLTAARHTR